MGRIELDYRKAINQAEKFEEMATKLEDISENKMEDIMNSVAMNWTGNTSNMYCNKGRKLGQDIGQTARNLRDIASDIRTVANRVREAERRAEELARKRTYGNGI